MARLSFSSKSEAIAAAVAGQGVALERRPLVDTLLASGQLVTPFDAGIASARAYRFIVDPAVKAFEKWLLRECGTG